MQPKLPSSVVIALANAPGLPLPAGADPGRVDAVVPPGVFVEELAASNSLPFRGRGEVGVRVRVMWRREPWRWWPLAADFVLIISSCILLFFVAPLPLALTVSPIGLFGGLLFAWDQLGRLLNSTMIECCHGWLTVRHGPIPWTGSKRLPLERIENLFWIEDRSVIRVLVHLAQGPEVWLLRGTTTIGLTADQAHYVVERIKPLIDGPMPRVAVVPTRDQLPSHESAVRESG